MTVREQIEKMPRGEFLMLTNTRNNDQADAIRKAWLVWLDAQSRAPKTQRDAWYGFQAYRQQLPPGSQI